MSAPVAPVAPVPSLAPAPTKAAPVVAPEPDPAPVPVPAPAPKPAAVAPVASAIPPTAPAPGGAGLVAAESTATGIGSCVDKFDTTTGTACGNYINKNQKIILGSERFLYRANEWTC